MVQVTPQSFLKQMLHAFILCIAILAVTSFAYAEPASVDVISPGANTISVVLATPHGGNQQAKTLQKYIKSNFAIMPFVKLLDPSAVPGGATTGSGKAGDIDFKRFSLAGAQYLISTNWTSAQQVELRFFEVAQGSFIFGNIYTIHGGEESVRDQADRFCDDFLKAVIGRGGLFSSKLAFSRSGGAHKKDIWTVKVNGRGLRQLTNMPGEAISPAWSPDASKIIFTHIDLRSHGLGIWSGSSKIQRVRFPGNTVIGPCFFPDGRIAVSLTDGRNPSLFLLSALYQKERKLDESHGIDVSASIDASGSKMAFTSSRLGGPQVFIKDFMAGTVTRVTTQGNYNTDPSLSPDATVVAFARRTESGHRIFVRDLVKGTEQQVTYGPGSDEEPSFAPDSYFIAFMSTRSGQKKLYLTTRYGGEPVAIPVGNGDASFPAWGKGHF